MDDVMGLIDRAHHGDERARAQLVEQNMGLVWSIVRRFSGRGTENEDLFQIGAIGLMKAIDKFDCSFEVRFSTYAVPMIMGEIKRFLRDDGLVKVSRTLKENGWKIRRETENYRNRWGREPTLEELAEATALSREEIVEAAKKASVHDFIQALPDGYDTKVGELGDTLSGGEKQRIGIARAFLHDAPFLLMDEPTSNLDSLNEGIILKSIRESCENRTVVLVSHRQSTMNVADEVYEMENGRMS